MAVCVFEPLVPVKVIVLELMAALLEAASWKDTPCAGPVVDMLYGPDGVAVTPAGSPDIVTVTVPVNPFNGVAEMLWI